MIIVIVGIAGSGKTTQSKLLAKKIGVPAISMGEVLRNARDAKTVLGIEATKYLEEGKLVPAKLMKALTRFRLAEDDCKDGFILDGAPRRVEEAVMLDDYLSGRSDRIDYVFSIEITKDEAIKRLLKRYEKPKDKGGKRSDDNIEDIKTRIFEYYDNIDAVKVYYRKKDILEIVDGSGEIEDIHRGICNILQL